MLRTSVLLSAWLLVCVVHLAASAARIDVPGLYYDEVVQAGPAADFVRGRAGGRHVPGSDTVRIAGRPFPWKTLPYMGALKSQALIPVFAVFEPDALSLRMTTQAWALIAIGLSALWAHLVFGLAVGLLTLLLLAVDPSVFFIARHDWGSFALAFLLRAAAVLLVLLGWRTHRTWPWAAAGLLAGLAIYNKIDAVVPIAGLCVAAVVAYPRAVVEAISARPKTVAAGVTAAILGASPMVSFLFRALRAAGQMAGKVAFDEKLGSLWSTLDGSYFYRLMAGGGPYERIFEADAAPGGVLPHAFAATTVVCFLALVKRDRCHLDRNALVFTLTAALLTLGGLLVLPGAAQVHHMLNVTPWVHLTVAAGAWQLAAVLGRRAATWRIASATAVVAVVAAGSLAVGSRTFALLTETGGRGWWSSRLSPVLDAIDASATTRVVSLDWGFNEQILYLRPDVVAVEGFWDVDGKLKAHGRWRLEGGPETTYLAHGERFDLFGYGSRVLDVAETADDERVVVDKLYDERGELAFAVLRIRAPHRIEIERIGDGESAAGPAAHVVVAVEGEWPATWHEPLGGEAPRRGLRLIGPG